MGGGASKKAAAAAALEAGELLPEQLEKMMKEHKMSSDEIRFLHKRFKSVCVTNGKAFTRDDIPKAASLTTSTYLGRIFDALPKNQAGDVEFESFLAAAKVFRPGQSIEDKLEFVFSLFDYNFDNSLDSYEVQKMLQLIRPSIPESKQRSMVLQTMSEITGSAGNEPITRENFKEYARKLPGIEELLTIDINFAVQQEKLKNDEL